MTERLDIQEVASQAVYFSDEEFRPPSAFDESVADSQIVILGEQSHGDAAAMEVKSKLVKHLHLNLGFDVLAFEADFFALERAWTNALTQRQAGMLSEHVYRFWGSGTHVSGLWNLVQDRMGTSRPLIISGIDVRHTGNYAKSQVADSLETLLLAQGLQLDADWHEFRTFLTELLEEEYRHSVSSAERMRFMEHLERLQNLLTRDDEESRFWSQELSSLAWTGRTAWGFEGRDEGMGRNLAWLANERYKGKRIIVWAHNYHAVRSKVEIDRRHPPYASERRKYPDTPLGEVAAREVDGTVVSYALVAGQGWRSPNAWSGDVATRADLAEPPVNSLEDALLSKGYQYAFLDLKRVPGRFTMSGTEHDTPINANWSQVFDGVLFMRNMTGLT